MSYRYKIALRKKFGLSTNFMMVIKDNMLNFYNRKNALIKSFKITDITIQGSRNSIVRLKYLNGEYLMIFNHSKTMLGLLFGGIGLGLTQKSIKTQPVDDFLAEIKSIQKL